MANEEKRASTRERVKRHRAIKADTEETLRRRARYLLRQREFQTSGQTDVAVGDADNDPQQDMCVGFVSSGIIGEPASSDSEVQSFVDGEPSVEFSNQDEQIVVAEPSSAAISGDEVARDAIENAFDEGQMETESNESLEEIIEISQLRDWAIQSGARQNKLDQLLAILRRRLLPSLPKSSKTFLNTAGADYVIREMESADGSKGEYVYFGIAENLLARVRETLHEDKTFNLQFNVDGVPLFNSSSKQFWPILCKLRHSPDVYKPFVVAIYCGDSKPNDVNDFLTDFVCEINKLLTEGIKIKESNFSVKIHCFICDTPARAFLKCTKGHGGYFACERCETRGERIDNRTVYPEVDCPERTDRSFRQQYQQEHHTGQSLLVEIQPLDLVFRFALDFMHLCCIGIMKKLSEYWIFGKVQNRMQRRNKLGSQQRFELSNRMDNLRRCIPVEFQRKPRSVNRLAMWKATEFRFFLLYCGPIVLRGILSPNLYKHFLLLHTACRILCSKEFAFRYTDHAKIFLRTFFTSMPVFYGRQSQILNAHNLIHIADDVKNMDCTLSEISAFPFESLLGRIKMLLRNSNRPLAQVCRRLHELSVTEKKVSVPQAIEILKFGKQKEAERIEVKKIRYNGFVLTTKFPNNLVLLNSDVILIVTKMMCSERFPQSTEIEGTEWKIASSLFKYPTPSSTLKMWRLASEPTSRKIKCYVHEVHCKMVQMEIKGRTRSEEVKYYAVPFLHT